MIDIQEYIDSGVLELYVFGKLSETKSHEVSTLVAKHPELLVEVERIEEAMFTLSRAAAPKTPSSFDHVLKRINEDVDVIPLSRKQNSWKTYIQVAAGILMIGTIGFQIDRNLKLKNQLVDIQEEQLLQEAQTKVVEENLVEMNRLLTLIRNKNVVKVPLVAQKIDPKAFATVYWDNPNNKAYVDVRGLPQPPEGKVYQVWSLTLDPLTPTSMGVLDNYDTEGVQLFEFDISNASQAFGITLEPEGGSETPTMEQLYTLGVVTP